MSAWEARFSGSSINAIDDVGTAAGANGLNVTMDAQLVSDIKAIALAVKAAVVVHQKSMRAGVAEIRAVQATTTTLGRSTGIHLECSTHHNVGEKGDRSPDQRLSRIGIYAAAAQVYR